jgi:hypothetical protein
LPWLCSPVPISRLPSRIKLLHQSTRMAHLSESSLAQKANELTEDELHAVRKQTGPVNESGYAVTGCPYPLDNPIFHVNIKMSHSLRRLSPTNLPLTKSRWCPWSAEAPSTFRKYFAFWTLRIGLEQRNLKILLVAV